MYDSGSKSCFPRNGTSVPVAKSGAVSGPRVCQNCFQYKFDYLGHHVAISPNIPNPEDCQKVCQANADCKFFTWDSRNNNCWLKHGAPIPNPYIDLVSGPRSCTACFYPQVDVESSTDIVTSGNVKSTEECQKICQSNYDCRFFTYNSSKSTCVLKRAAMGPFTSTSSTLGPKYC
jgi:hypothetical protein